MPVSEALERSANHFCAKYACDFDFASFEAGIEEFTFLRPVSGWIDLYKTTFEHLYRHALESVALGTSDDGLNAEAMLDDFEYTLMRPYANEGNKEIKHKPYGGMDRITRLEYLGRLTRGAPSNFVELYAEKYRQGELSLEQMRGGAVPDGGGRERLVEIAGCAQALEAVWKGRSVAWRVLHPFKSNAERNGFARLRRTITESLEGGEELYRKAAEEARAPFNRYRAVYAKLEQGMLHAREDMTREQKMNDVMRESIRIEELEKDSIRERSPRVDHHKSPERERNIRR